MLAGAAGRIVEVGVGSGRNFPHYIPGQVTHVCGVDPDPAMLAIAERAGPYPFPCELIRGKGDALPMKEGSQDTLVLAFTLCTVSNPEQTLEECYRVLKPGGTLLFAEHGLSPDAGVATWQHRLNPLWKRLAGGCHLNRDPIPHIEGAGLKVEQVRQHYMKGVPRFAGYVTNGQARRPIRISTDHPS